MNGRRDAHVGILRMPCRLALLPLDRKGTLMHAVVVKVTIKEQGPAEERVRSELVPRVSSAPGFVAGYWVRLPGDKGTSVTVFESEQAANAAAGQVEPGPNEPVSIDSVEVGEVVGHA